MRISIVIPANNEEQTIGRLLTALQDLSGVAEVVVVCNGCTDGTAGAAHLAAPWARVLELAEGSKSAALRAGDEALSTDATGAAAGVRLYLDADVVLDADGVRRLADALDRDQLKAVAPTPRYVIDGATPLVRSHYRIWTALYTHIDHVYGTGAIMLSPAGRTRFDTWPTIIADDYYIDLLFGPGEKRRLEDVSVDVELPHTFRSCVSRKARVHEGKRQILSAGLLAEAPAAEGRSRSLLALVHSRPELTRDVPAHLIVTVASRVLAAWRRLRGRSGVFYRDSTSRKRRS